MSRIGKQPVPIIDGVSVNLDGKTINVEGPEGKLSFEFRPEISVEVDGNMVKVSRNNDSRESRAYHGLTRALINNMIQGVKTKYEKKLELQGVGYVCSADGKNVCPATGLNS